jgi:cyclic dehypoxanthinyl futalosine synthase
MPIRKNQALDYFHSSDLIGLGMEADAVRRNAHPEEVVTYALECEVSWPSTPENSAITQARDAGANGIVLTGDQIQDIHQCKRILSAIHQSFPDLSVSAFSAAELQTTARASGLSLQDILSQLMDAGLNSIRAASFEECSREDWLEIHRTAHRMGMRTIAKLSFSSGENINEFLDLLDKVRSLHEEFGGFAAFYPSTDRNRVTSVEYLKALAVSRLFLDSIENLQSDLSAQGLKVLQLSFRFGANDAGSVSPAIGSKQPDFATEEILRHTIRGAGFQPVPRNLLYTTCFLN